MEDVFRIPITDAHLELVEFVKDHGFRISYLELATEKNPLEKIEWLKGILADRENRRS